MGHLGVFIIVTILFSLYVEFHPSMGGIWIRPDSNNIKRIHLSSLFNLMISPLTKKYFWNYSLLSINYIFILILTFTTLYLKDSYFHMFSNKTLQTL